MIRTIEKRDGTIARFNPEKIRSAIRKAVRSTYVPENTIEKTTNDIYDNSLQFLDQSYNNHLIPKQSDIERVIIETARKLGHINVASSYDNYKEKRKKARETLALITNTDQNNTTDASLLIESDSQELIGGWDKNRIIEQLKREAKLAEDFATEIAKKAENLVVDLYENGVRRLSTTDIREIVDILLKQDGLEFQKIKQELIGIPSSDLESIIFSKSMENSNISANNPEAVNLGIAEISLKKWALRNIFSKDVAEAHLKGAIHLHDLGYPIRAYCSSHSIEYLKKYGLGTVVANLESKSNSPNSAAVLNQHIQTFLASLQAHYAGALGFGFLNLFYAPLLKRPVKVIHGKIDNQEWTLEKKDLEKLVEQREISLEKDASKKYFEVISEKNELKEISYNEIEQIAQNLIFASSQNAFSRGGQTLFIDFNIHTGVPNYLKNVPAIGPGGKYMIQLEDGTIKMVSDVPRINLEDKLDPRNGDIDNSKIKNGKILTYKDFEETAQKFAKAMMEVWRKGDKYGRPFHFPKCDLHIDENSFRDPKQLELIDFATKVTAENGSIYFMFDRGDGAVLAQCCRLKEKITDTSMLKYPEKLRFCGFQNVTINLAQAAYKGKNLEGTLNEIDKSMELALKAHNQKAEFMQKLLDTDGSPMRSLGKPSDDGNPYIDLKKATYIIGNIGLNEAVQVLTGKQLHEGEEAYELGLKIIAHMYKNIQEFKEKTGLKFTIEETPAESTTRRLAKVDLKYFDEAKKVVKGTEKDPYYTNSIHFAPDADVSLVDRIVGQSNFHDMIESGAIVHAYIGEKRPNKEVIKQIVKNTLENTRCSQLVFSPTYTECDECGNIMPGEKELCNSNGCSNSNPKTVDKDKLSTVTRIVGYYSRVPKWNGSQQEIQKARLKTEELYSGENTGRDMSWLYNTNNNEKIKLIQFGKSDCGTCKNLENNIYRVLDELGIKDKVNYQNLHLDKLKEEDLVEAAKYGIPLDTVPSLVITGKNTWKKTTHYSAGHERSDLIKPKEIKEQLQNELKE